MPDFQPTPTDPATAAYGATVDALWPGLPATLRDLRVRIMAVRDKAAVGALSCQGDSYALLTEIRRLGSLYALAGMSVTQLIGMVHALEAMLVAARDIEKATR